MWERSCANPATTSTAWRAIAAPLARESVPDMSPIYLIEGPVGAGKSTFAQSLATRLPGTHIALDEWFAKLFSPDRPGQDVVTWYLQRKDRLLNVIWTHAAAMARAGQAPILELGLIQRQARYDLYARARDAGITLEVYVLDAAPDVRRQRVRQRNEQRGSTFSMVVPDHVFELASSMWQAPDRDEIAELNATVLTTDAPG
ncbi:AAA family ATPase [Bradyrhizobium sp. U87765 SZCCT0131]|uniref:AAA family ATPase n=1 Tax=unclassified Bradyrhizobium TaxID=2631580 RepID=UPI001BADA916|nr:AAA family ATPase [Bradyrhizobium sp. U87765 SZCCT0131]MBR1345735.1 AAA family ATPase [Bradyrhizobium sp. U87765 SZCCT0048]